MKGTHKITIYTRKLRYDLRIRRNITIIRGNSATGKTTLVEMIREYEENGSDSGITLNCDKECRVIGGRAWKAVLSTIHDSIVFIDEDNAFLPTNEFAEAVRNSDNYYVIITREGLPNLPYSVTEIYGIRESGKYVSMQQTYNEMYRIYGDTSSDTDNRPDLLIVEDSDAGFEFYEKNTNLQVISAKGKSNIFEELLKHKDEKCLVIADGAAFGAEMDRVIKEVKREGNTQLFLPESFEWLILKSGLVDGNYVKEILENPSDSIESSEYFSWERFFTALLVEQTQGTFLQYNKRKLNPTYLQKNIATKILAILPIKIADYNGENSEEPND